MKAIIVDDELLMLKKFARLSEVIEDLTVVGQFESAKEALAYVKEFPVEVAFLDVAMPVMNGVELAKALRKIRPDMIIVFVSAYDRYLWDFNQISGDYYIIKPYSEDTLKMAMEKIRLLAQRQQKEVHIQTFGHFLVTKNGKPIPLTGKAKEILALVVARRGKEISNEEIYTTLWENRPCRNVEMTVYYNALRRLKTVLRDAGLSDLLLSTRRGQMINQALFDCDFYSWQDKNMTARDRFEGEFMAEYTRGEYFLPEIIKTE